MPERKPSFQVTFGQCNYTEFWIIPSCGFQRVQWTGEARQTWLQEPSVDTAASAGHCAVLYNELTSTLQCVHRDPIPSVCQTRSHATNNSKIHTDPWCPICQEDDEIPLIRLMCMHNVNIKCQHRFHIAKTRAACIYSAECAVLWSFLKTVTAATIWPSEFMLIRWVCPLCLQKCLDNCTSKLIWGLRRLQKGHTSPISVLTNTEMLTMHQTISVYQCKYSLLL